MKKVQVNEILVDQANRRRTIVNFALLIIVLLVASAAFMFIFIQNNRTHYITYNENSNLDYKVYLKNNDYFAEKYLNKDKQYIASLIENIDAKFDYNFDVEDENINYQYSYRIESEVNVEESSNRKVLFNKVDTIIKKQTITTNSEKNVRISDNVVIDYNYYNGLISKFVKDYELDNYKSYLKINMYVDVFGTCDEIIKGNNKEAVISLTIPLTTKTVAIDIGSDVTETNNNSIACKLSDDNFMYVLYISLVIGVIAILTIYLMIRYILKTRTPDDIYHSELKKILNRYHSYIQKITNFDLRGYQAVRVNNFDDLLEVRDCYQSPILMLEDKGDDKNTSFYVPTPSKIIYVYEIKVK